MGAFNKVFIRLVKAYVAVKTDTQKLQIDAAQFRNMLVIALTLARQIDRAAVGDKGIVNADINVIEEIMIHKIAVALIVFAVKPYIFVKIY